MKHGCFIIGAIALLGVILSLGYCGYSLYSLGTTELPKARLAVDHMIGLYNQDDFDGLYAHADSAWKKSLSPEKSMEQIKKFKQMTGQVKIIDQVGFHMRVHNAERYITLTFTCTGDKGDTQLSVVLHDEDGWKMQRINFNLK